MLACEKFKKIICTVILYNFIRNIAATSDIHRCDNAYIHLFHSFVPTHKLIFAQHLHISVHARRLLVHILLTYICIYSKQAFIFQFNTN